MSEQNLHNQVGQAWNYHLQGKHQDAAAAFEHILKASPKDVDAHYGHGLSLRALGDRENARESFRKGLEYAQATLAHLRGGGGGQPTNDITSSEDDRYLMLTRMLGQRLAELDAE